MPLGFTEIDKGPVRGIEGGRDLWDFWRPEKWGGPGDPVELCVVSMGDETLGSCEHTGGWVQKL